MTFAPHDPGAGRARLPLQFGIVNMLLALMVLAGVANAGEWAFGRTPTVIGILASFAVVAAWGFVGWLKGRDGSTRFAVAAGLGWIALIGGFAVALWAIEASKQSGEPVGGTFTVAIAFITAAPFHGIAGLLPLAMPVNYYVAQLSTLLVAAVAWFVGRAMADPGIPGSPATRGAPGRGPARR